MSNTAVKLLPVVDEARDAVLAHHGWICALEYVSLPVATIPGYVNFRYPPGNRLRNPDCPEEGMPRWTPIGFEA